jgi:hypothetical protein
MAKSDNFPAIFEQLKTMLQPLATAQLRQVDTPTLYSLDAPASQAYPKGTYFAVKIGKNYVSYHLMAVYMFPELLENISVHLKKRMQGKACFNFSNSLDTVLLTELAELTKVGLDRCTRA